MYRLNINGAIEFEHLEPVVRFDDTINAASTIALFRQIEQTNPQSAVHSDHLRQRALLPIQGGERLLDVRRLPRPVAGVLLGLVRGPRTTHTPILSAWRGSAMDYSR